MSLWRLAVVDGLEPRELYAAAHRALATTRAGTAVADNADRIDAQLRAPSVDANGDDANVMGHG